MEGGTLVSAASLTQISNLFRKIYKLLGVNLAKKDQSEIDEELFLMAEHVMRVYRQYTLEEISMAYDLALSGNLDIKNEDIISQFAPVQFGKIMSAYKKYKQKNGTLRQEIERKNALALPEPQVDTEAVLRYTLENAYEFIKAGNDYMDYGNLLYDYLNNRQLIPFTPERKLEFMKLAASDHKAFLTEKMQLMSYAERHEAKSLKERILQFTQETYPTAFHDEIVVRAKHLAFNQLVKDLIEQDITIQDYLESHDTAEPNAT